MNDTKRIRTERQIDKLIAEAKLLRVRLSIAAEGESGWIDTSLRRREQLLEMKVETAAAMIQATTPD
jgi:hypothetical protein